MDKKVYIIGNAIDLLYGVIYFGFRRSDSGEQAFGSLI